MASWNIPALVNAIKNDIVGLGSLLRSLAIGDPSAGNSDLPAQSKRMQEGTDGWEWQMFNGNAWNRMAKWNINAAQVDGFDASAGTTANTIPVRDKNGDLPGNVLGNAATATKAEKLSATNPVEMGGTGATTPQQARQNLGTPPTEHSSSGTEFGLGTSVKHGHTKLSDATDSSSDTSGGTAATPKAVKTAKAEAVTAASEALTAFAEGQSQKDAEQDEKIAEAKSSAEAAINELGTELGDFGTRLGELEAEVEGKADASALESKVSSINGTMTFDLDNGSTIELRRAGDAGAYTLSVVYIAEDGTKKFGVLMNSEGEFLPGAFYAPNFAAGVQYSKGSTNTIPSNGYLKGTIASSDYDTVDLTINGTVFQIPTDTGHNTMLIPVKKGDTVKYTDTGPNWGSSVTFYPAR